MHQYRCVLHLHPKPHDATGQSNLCEHQQVLGQTVESLDHARRVCLVKHTATMVAFADDHLVPSSISILFMWCERVSSSIMDSESTSHSSHITPVSVWCPSPWMYDISDLTQRADCLLICHQVMLIGLMSLKNHTLFVQFHPVACESTNLTLQPVRSLTLLQRYGKAQYRDVRTYISYQHHNFSNDLR
jgi:hypothetical protein